MDAERFDALSRALTTPGSRRVSLRALLTTLLGGALLGRSPDARAAATKKKVKTKSRKATGRGDNRQSRPPHDRQAGQHPTKKQQKGQRERKKVDAASAAEPTEDMAAPVDDKVTGEAVTAADHGCGHPGTVCGADEQCCSGLCSDVHGTCCLGYGSRCKGGSQCCSGLCKGRKKKCRCATTSDCAGGRVCRSGRCVCDTRVGCGDACPCPNGKSCRNNGQCGDPCGADEQECDGVCRNLQNDENHCGECGKRCDALQECRQGACRCPVGAQDGASCGPNGEQCRNGECLARPICKGAGENCGTDNHCNFDFNSSCCSFTCAKVGFFCSCGCSNIGVGCKTDGDCCAGRCVAFECRSECPCTGDKVCQNERCVCDDTRCGNGCDCSGGKTCVAGSCCPDARACPTTCCPADQTCVAGNCCPNTRVCGITCCPVGEACTGGACCPNTQICGTGCCPEGQTCAGGACCPEARACGTVCCNSHEVCQDATTGRCERTDL